MNWKMFALLAALLTSAIGPARADETQDFLASVKAQAASAKAELEKAKAKAKADAHKAQKVAAETRMTCQDLINTAAELAEAELEAKKQAEALQEAQAEAGKLLDAAKVRKVLVQEGSEVDAPYLGRIAARVPMPPPPHESMYADESPDVTRARVVGVCKAILVKPTVGILQPGDPMLRGKK